MVACEGVSSHVMGLWPIFCLWPLLLVDCAPLRARVGVVEMREQLIELLEPVVRQLGCELWELEFAGRRNGGLLRIYIDAAKGIDVEDCERVSRAVSALLDEADPIPGEYTLEVSSPGLDRVLCTPTHFARFVGARISVEMKALVNGRRKFLGKLAGATATTIELEVEGQPESLAMQLNIADIHKARLLM